MNPSLLVANVCLLVCLLFHSAQSEYSNAVCFLRDPSGGRPELKGAVHFRQLCDDEKLQIKVTVTGLDAVQNDGNLFHGFHVHQYGSIMDSCGTAGGHYNPEGVNHGDRTGDVRHVGDFGNIKQTPKGTINVMFSDPKASLFGANSIIGRAIVLHAGQDDLGTVDNPGSRANGNAGARVACCVIGWASSQHWG